jgi:Protein of unknown function (DUF1616)
VKLEEYKLIFAAVGLIGIILLATPALGAIIRFPSGEPFSEIYLLGPEHLAQNYPSNIAVGQNYSVYVGVGNHLGASAYYVLYAKFQNVTDLLPNATTETPSPAPPLYESRFSIPDGKNWEGLLTFSVSKTTTSPNQSVVETFMVNDFNFNVNKQAAWDSNSTTFSYRLVFELWLYNATSNSVQFNNRFVDLQLNLIKTT